MQLTLKNLLLYLDDALEPQEAAAMGQKIADSPGAQRLIEVLRQLTRRRVLAAPDFEKPKDSEHDANQVAAYLDGMLEDAETAAFERLCLDDAELIAEVAAVHQLNSLGASEPVLVPPTARQRLYGLVSGQEADPKRQAKPVPDSVHELAWDVDGQPAEGEDELFLEPLWFKFQKGWKGRLIPLAAVLLLVCLAGVVYLATLSRPEPDAAVPRVALAPSDLAAPAAPTASAAASKAEPSVPAASAASKPTEPAPTLVAAADRPRPEVPSAPLPTAPAAQTLPTRPTTATAPTAPTVPTPPQPTATTPKPTEPEASKPPAPVKPPVPNVAVGQYTSDPARDGMIFCYTLDGKWILERPQARLLTGEPILALPGTRAEFLLTNKMKVILHGTVPGAMSINYFFETQATVNFNDQADLDLTLDRGRVQIFGMPEGIATVKIRYQETTWDLRLLTPDTEIGIEVTGRVPPGSGAWTPHSRLAIFVMKGELSARRGEAEERLGPRKVLVWDSVHTDAGPGMAVPQSEPPAWMTRRPAYPAEVRDGLAAFYRRLSDKLTAQGQDLAWMVVASDEALSTSRRPWEQYLAVFVLGALDQLGPVIEALDHPDSPYVRRAAMDALLHFLGRKPGQVDVLTKALMNRGYGQADRDVFLKLVRRIDKPDRAATEQLLEWLNHPRLAIRELAFLNLVALLPTDRLAGYDPNAPVEQRERAIAQLRSRLLK